MKKAIFAAAIVALFYGSFAKGTTDAGSHVLHSGFASTAAQIEAATK